MFEHTNWLAVLVAALASLPVGFIWYNPKVFGTAWMKAAGVDMNASKSANMPLIFGLTILMSMVVCAFLSTWVHSDEHLGQFMHGAYHGFHLCIFVAVPFMVINALFERKNFTYMLINA